MNPLARPCRERRFRALCSRSFCRVVAAPLACTGHVSMLPLGRKHVVIHGDDHGDEHDRVIEKMEFNPGKDQLQYAARHRLAPKIMVRGGLPDQQKMLDVVPELDPESDHPPGMGDSGKAFAKNHKQMSMTKA